MIDNRMVLISLYTDKRPHKRSVDNPDEFEGDKMPYDWPAIFSGLASNHSKRRSMSYWIDTDIVEWLRSTAKRLGIRSSDLASFAIRMLMGMGEGELLTSPIDRANRIFRTRKCTVITNGNGKANK